MPRNIDDMIADRRQKEAAERVKPRARRSKAAAFVARIERRALQKARAELGLDRAPLVGGRDP